MHTPINILIFLLIIILTLIGLQSCYYTNQGYYLLNYTYSAKNIDKLLKDEQTSNETKEFLIKVKEIKKYAKTIGLNGDKKYNTYKELEKNYLVAVVQAAEDLSVEPYKWNYIFMGKLPYKGFYNVEHAKKEAKRMKEKGYDVFIRPVSAFSTLNILPDPLFSFMKDYAYYELVETLLHEQVHSTIWLKRHDSYNEQLATFIGHLAMLDFMENKYGKDSPEYEKIFQDSRDSKTYIKILIDTKKKLETMYKDSNLTNEEKLLQKQQILDEQQHYFEENYDELFETNNYKKAKINSYNNAFFALISTYEEKSTSFQDAFERCNRDLVFFITQMKLVTSNKEYTKDPYAFLATVPITQ